ncbi:CD-NTase-associated protein 12/Pycsar effector protein TIR domain-containing protein [Deinococcus saxicola]|uniref:TIR domain-containing protein n=1 Tax=Deinococcus saxicola TaxID=249406 RepID=UPI0039F0BD4C
MSELNRETAVAILAGIQKSLVQRGSNSYALSDLLKGYGRIRPQLKSLFPDLMSIFSDTIPEVKVSKRDSISSYEYSEGIREFEFTPENIVSIYKTEISTLVESITNLKSQNILMSTRERRVFISHGRSEDWRKVENYIFKTLEIPTLELAQQSNKGRTIFQKLIDESDQCSYAVIIMTGDDLTTDEQLRARENVIHEIGYFQGKYGPSRVCLLHEESVNIPTNLQGIVYIPFPKDYIEVAFGGLTNELKHI